ncbi:molybdopterin-dependent oxidoreductase [Reyranella sp. CPCC 100927]|uniref:molybdopterin-containing oxidoreductase family protein n=1 Tax=Reyranella sp. CPCC 100927 TaxID=2599616 RepID=UPI0011B3E5B2|nr:molybdopterin-dependent oxidoreductase [Reyranella sp. CPCC 100927]TWT09545.1 molybdopterin-dependent oxidoreductase [Reyranella sp. CPCC 100927]
MAEQKIFSACPHDCPDTCAMITTVRDGKAVAVRGNPDHPFTRGGLCVKVNDYQNRVYSPDRVLFPLKRIGPKGAGQFERITWDAALAEIKTQWTAIIDRHGPAAILPYSYLGTEGILNGLGAGDAFFNKLGAAISERTFCDSAAISAFFMSCGPTAAVDPESFVHSRYIVLWAINTISNNLHHWPFIAEAQARGAKVVVIDPVATRTAKKADWHIRIRPGTDAALALGMMNVIIAEGLVDHDYVDKYTVGYEDLKQRAAQFPPDKVAAITGVAADDVRTLAREFATAQPSVIRMGVAIERSAGGGNTVRALSCLPALVGSWRHCGGGILHMPIWAFPVNWDAVSRPDWIRPGTPVVNQWRLGPALTGELPLKTPIQSLFVFNSNPMVVIAEQEKLERGLAREDLFTVVSEQFLTDTALYADIVLPATTQLEQFDVMFSWGHLYLTLNEPAVAPLGEAVSNTELFRRLARAMGFNDDYWQRNDEEMVAAALDWNNPVLEGIDLASLRRTGYARLKVGTPDTFVPHREGNFPTPSGKCEFKSSIAAGGNMVLPLFRQGYAGDQSGEALDPLPNYIPPNESPATNPALASRYTLNMLSPKSHAFLNSSYGNMALQQHHAGAQKVILNPHDATVRGIAGGEVVRVFNDRGAFEAIAEISGDTMAGIVVAPMGYWPHHNRSRRSVNAINPPAFADYGNAPTFSDTLVEVAKASLLPQAGREGAHRA